MERLIVAISEEKKEKMRLLAELKGVNLSSWVRLVLIEKVDNDPSSREVSRLMEQRKSTEESGDSGFVPYQNKEK